ncbi:MAG: YtxH domain-containing protein [Bacteroidota bacterium]
MNNSGKIIGAALAGAAVGAATALLLAPMTGADTRKKIMSKVKSAKDTVDGYLAKGEEAVNNINGSINKAKDAVRQA